MLCFSTWITLLILIGSVWSQTPDIEPSARSLKFGGALVESARAVFCDKFCNNLGRLLFIRNIGCFVNCPELWRPPATTNSIPTKDKTTPTHKDNSTPTPKDTTTSKTTTSSTTETIKTTPQV